MLTNALASLQSSTVVIRNSSNPSDIVKAQGGLLGTLAQIVNSNLKVSYMEEFGRIENVPCYISNLTVSQILNQLKNFFRIITVLVKLSKTQPKAESMFNNQSINDLKLSCQ